jgi:ABC-2 type transport system ATP-binding protein
MIRLEGLTREYGGRPAVRELSLEIPAGEVFGLLGTNGAGKSTTLKMLATLLRPSAGTARVGGHDLIAEPNEVRKVIGYVPEGADLYEVLSGEEFLDLVRDLHRVPIGIAAERRATLASSFSMEADLLRTIGEYSKGMRQKLLLIAALQHDPTVLLLDEPLDGLDVQAQAALKDLIRKRADQGGCVVYSSHILEVVERVCDRVGILHQGRLAALGAPREMTAERGETFSELFLRVTDGGGASL